MELILTLEEAQNIDADAVARIQKEAAKKLKRSRAKKKGKDISELVWSIQYSEEIQNDYSIDDIFSGRRTVDEAAKRQRSTDAKVADIVGRTHASLAAQMPGAWASASLESVPQILVDEIRNRVLQDEAEQARIDAMTPEERQKEIQELLGELRGPGFMELHMEKGNGS